MSCHLLIPTDMLTGITNTTSTIPNNAAIIFPIVWPLNKSTKIIGIKKKAKMYTIDIKKPVLFRRPLNIPVLVAISELFCCGVVEEGEG